MTHSGDLISLVYLSEAVGHFSHLDLAELLAKSRANNSTLGITGMLLFKEGKFLQALEGKRDDAVSKNRQGLSPSKGNIVVQRNDSPERLS